MVLLRGIDQFGGEISNTPLHLLSLGGIEYAYAPVQAATSVSVAGARVGGGIQFPLTGGIAVFAYGAGGYYFGTYNDFAVNATDPLCRRWSRDPILAEPEPWA